MSPLLRKHSNCSDVAASFLRVVPIPKGFKVKLAWYNIVNPDNIYPIGIIEEVFISKEQMKEWRAFTPRNIMSHCNPVNIYPLIEDDWREKPEPTWKDREAKEEGLGE